MKQKFISLLIVFSSLLLFGCNQKTDDLSEEEPVVYENYSLEEQLTFYSSVSFESGEVPSPVSVHNLYFMYKNRDYKDRLESFANNANRFTLTGDNYYICYYLKNDLYQEVINSPAAPASGVVVYNDLLKFIDLYRQEIKNKSFITENVLSKTIHVNNTSIKKQLNDYSLLAFSRFYREERYQNYIFVDFPSFLKDGSMVYPKHDSNMDSRIFLTNSLFFNNLAGNHFSLIDSFKYSGLEILSSNNQFVVEERFFFTHSLEEQYPDYYDEIKQCIVSKTLFKEYENGDKYYDVIFNYNSLKNLFGFKE